MAEVCGKEKCLEGWLGLGVDGRLFLSGFAGGEVSAEGGVNECGESEGVDEGIGTNKGERDSDDDP